MFSSTFQSIVEVLTRKVQSFLQLHIPIIQVLTRKVNLLQQHIPVVKVLMRIFLNLIQSHIPVRRCFDKKNLILCSHTYSICIKKNVFLQAQHPLPCPCQWLQPCHRHSYVHDITCQFMLVRFSWLSNCHCHCLR